MILLTGATGYVGGQLLQRLLSSGRRVRCMTRRPEAMTGTGVPPEDVVSGDVLDPAALEVALAGVDEAYYLIHSMASDGNFEERDRKAARLFGEAARKAGVSRIIYLGGLGSAGETLSPHLRSRHEVGEVLRDSGVKVIEFRASIVIGAGSLSFEMVRALVERLPVMIAPRWVSVQAQPISIDDLLGYLEAALDIPLTESRVFEIGGADQVSYGGLMREYARQRGLKRWIISVPFLTPKLSSLWLGLVTPLYVRVGRKLIDSICHPTVVEDTSGAREFAVRPCDLREALAKALQDGRGNTLCDSRTIEVDTTPAQAFRPIRRIGGKTGWYYANWLWQLRGALDLLLGGVGMRRGRPDAEELREGDILDCWRVESIEQNRRLRLAAEMKLPGRAWLEFEVSSLNGRCSIRQTALFDAKGLLGRAYWYSLYPLHDILFRKMLQKIGTAATSGT